MKSIKYINFKSLKRSEKKLDEYWVLDADPAVSGLVDYD